MNEHPAEEQELWDSHPALGCQHHLRAYSGSGRNHGICCDTASLVSVIFSIARPERDCVSKWKKKIMC